ncbi:MAG: hypothetical protein ACI9DJ_002617 [Algoriphagus sp.]|jgi:hypothetical protein
MLFLPDLNQKNAFVANYLIHYTLSFTQNLGFDACHISTYRHNGMDFLNTFNDALMAQFPQIFLFGESLALPRLNQAAFVNSNLELSFGVNLESSVD